MMSDSEKPSLTRLKMHWVEEEGLFYVLDSGRPVDSGRFDFYCAGYASDTIVGLLEPYYHWTEEVAERINSA